MSARFDADEAQLMADAEARRLAAAARQRTQDKEAALTAALRELINTPGLSDEARQRIAELLPVKIPKIPSRPMLSFGAFRP